MADAVQDGGCHEGAVEEGCAALGFWKGGGRSWKDVVHVDGLSWWVWWCLIFLGWLMGGCDVFICQG